MQAPGFDDEEEKKKMIFLLHLRFKEKNIQSVNVNCNAKSFMRSVVPMCKTLKYLNLEL